MTEADVHTLTGAYALHALPEAEKESFEQHLAECPSCAQEVAEFAEVVGRLGSASAEEPPARLREHVLSAAKHTRQLPPAVPEEHPDELARKRAGRRARWWRRTTAFAAAAAVIAAVLLGYQNVVTNQRMNDLQQASDAYGNLSKLLATPDVRVLTQPVQGGGTATVVASRSRDSALVMAKGMAKPPEGHTYQVWVMSPQPRSAGLLSDVSRPHAQLMAHGIEPGDKVGLTVEPDGGSDQPTTSPVAVISL